jgi:prepilin-type processing-associated H-X9-DG protein
VRENGRQTACLSNLKQIGLAVQQYLQDNDNVYPSHLYGWNTELKSYIKSVSILWCPTGLQPYPGTCTLAECDNGVFSWEYCSANAQNTQSCGRCNIHFSNYHENFAVLNDLNVYYKQSSRGSHEAKFIDQASIVLANDYASEGFAEKVPNSCTIAMVGRSKEPKLFKQSDGFFNAHSGGGNYLFMDGHVKWLSPQDASKQQCEALTPLYAP